MRGHVRHDGNVTDRQPNARTSVAVADDVADDDNDAGYDDDAPVDNDAADIGQSAVDSAVDVHACGIEPLTDERPVFDGRQCAGRRSAQDL